MNTLEDLKNKGLYKEGEPLRLHLGCGQTKLSGFINIDYPQENHNVMQVAADYFSDIKDLSFPDNTVCRIELHHVFEHFAKYDALAMLIKWISWLKVGGQLVISTPDLLGLAQTICSDNFSFEDKMLAIRHLEGDQTDIWAFHIDHWFPERFEKTLIALGFDENNINIRVSKRCHGAMSDVRVEAIKHTNTPQDELIKSGYELLKLGMIDSTEGETKMFDIWCKLLLSHFEKE